MGGATSARQVSGNLPFTQWRLKNTCATASLTGENGSRPQVIPLFSRRHQSLPRCSVASVAAFICLYIVAAYAYPGGTRLDPARVGFSFVDNYWCDLLDAKTYGGRENPARPIAIAALMILCAGLSCLWWWLPASFGAAARRRVVVRSAGTVSAVVTPFIATSAHDEAINVAGLFALVAFVSTMSVVWKGSAPLVRRSAAAALVFAISSYAIWQSGIALRALPLVQKAAFASFLCWIIAIGFDPTRNSRFRAIQRK